MTPDNRWACVYLGLFALGVVLAVGRTRRREGPAAAHLSWQR